MQQWRFAILMGLLCSYVSPGGAVDASVEVPTTSSAAWRTVANNAFVPGEEFEFAVRFGVWTAGMARMTVAGVEAYEDRTAYHLVTEARSNAFASLFYSVKDRSDTWLDTESLSTLRYEKKVSERHYRVEEEVVFDQLNHLYTSKSLRIDKGTYEILHGTLPVNALDILGSFYYIRTCPMKVGDSFTMDVVSGEKVWPLVVQIKNQERIKVSAGKFDCFLLEPLLRGPGLFINKGKKLEVWVTADEKHMPVLMRAEIFVGHVSVELKRRTSLGARGSFP